MATFVTPEEAKQIRSESIRMVLEAYESDLVTRLNAYLREHPKGGELWGPTFDVAIDDEADKVNAKVISDLRAAGWYVEVFTPPDNEAKRMYFAISNQPFVEPPRETFWEMVKDVFVRSKQ
jgi:hypothetical protein